jgi:hypothetical protein
MNTTYDRRRADLSKQQRDASRKPSSVPEQHQLKILIQTLRMPDPIAGVMGGPSPKEAEKILREKFDYSDAEIRRLKKAYDRRRADLSELEQQRDARRWKDVQDLSKYGTRHITELIGAVNSKDMGEFYTALHNLCNFVGSMCSEMGNDSVARKVFSVADDIGRSHTSVF